MADNETRVIYKAIADFTALRRAVTGARKDLKDLNKDAAESSAKQTAAGRVQEAQNSRVARSVENMRAARDRHSSAASKEQAALNGLTEATKRASSAEDKAVGSTNKHTSAKRGLAAALMSSVSGLLQHAAAATKSANSMDKGTRSTVRFRSGLSAMFSRLATGTRTLSQTSGALDKLQDKIGKVFTKRSQLGGLPFGLLIPLILGVISAINPLISLLGAAGGAAIGFANSLASLSGVALALPGIFAAVASGIAGIMVAFGGVGKVFKLFSQKQAGGGGGGGGGGGQTAADRENALADAEDRVARAQRNVKKAQDNLNKARQQATRDLEDMRKAVARASADEADAVANLVQAQENYNNVFADSGSTAGDKLKAAADLTDAQNALDDTRQQNIRNTQDLTEAEKKGVEGSDQVKDATDNLTDALSEQRDALYALQKAQAGATGGGGGGGGGIDAFQEALDKLSPSAKAFVLGILAMKDAWDELHKSVQEQFFSRIVKDLPLISGFLPTLSNLLGKAAGAMGDVAHQGIVMITSGPWTKDFNTLADNNVGIIHDLGGALLSLLDSLRNITMAAAPFTKLLTGRFAQAMENLDKLTQKSRDDGSLAAWLDKVANRLTQWWNIVKNIGATLFNYGKAASGFGDWLTGGFEKVTEGWRKASEAANDPKSGFKKWLNDIKPLLSEVKGLLGDFWGWLKRTSADPKNIKMATDLLHTIRTELGPALGRLLDTMSKTGISEKLVKGVSSIVDAISKLIEKGGGAGMAAFFDILEKFFDVIDWIVSIPGVGETLGTIAGTLAAIAAIKFVSKFSGISALIELLLGLAGKKGDLLGIFEALTGLDLTKLRGTPIDPVTGKPTPAPTGGKPVDPITPLGKPGGIPDIFTKGGIPKGAGLGALGMTLGDQVIGPDTIGPDGKPMGNKAYITGSPKGDQELAKKIKDNTEAQRKALAKAAKKDPGGNIFTNPLGVLGHGGDQLKEWFFNLFNPKDQKKTPETTLAPGKIQTGKGLSVAPKQIGEQQKGPDWNALNPFGGKFDLGKFFDSINPFKNFKLDFSSIGGFLNSINPFKDFKIDWASIGTWLDSINPFKNFKIDFSSIGGFLDSINPFKGFSIDWASIGRWLDSVNPFKNFSIDWASIGKWLDSVNPFKGFKIDWDSIGKWLDSVNPFKGFKLDFNSIGSWLDSINPFSDHGNDKKTPPAAAKKQDSGGGFNIADLNPFKGLKLPDFGAIFGKQNPFANLQLPSFGGIFGVQNPFGNLQLPSFGGIFQGQVPGVSWPSFPGLFTGQVPNVGWPSWATNFLARVPNVGWANWALNFLGRVPNVGWPNFGQTFLGRVPTFGWPNFGAIFSAVLPTAWSIASQVYNAVAGAFSGIGGVLRTIFGSKGGAVKNAAKAKKNTPVPGGGGPVNTGTGGRGKGAKSFWTGGYAALAVGGRALENRPGGERPRQVGTDTIPAMLTRGEFVLRKGVVDSIGTHNLNALNEGLISYSDMLNMAMGNQKVQQKQKSTIPMAATSYFDGGGLAGRMANLPSGLRAVSPNQIPQQAHVSNSSNDVHIGQLTVQNPKPERASDTLPRMIRKTAYLGDRKPATVTPAGR